MRYSILVQNASLFEFYSRELCDFLADRDKTPIRSRELSGAPIDQMKVFISKFTSLLSVDDPRWQPVHDAIAFRNFIVHKNGFIDQDGHTKLKAALNRDSTITITDAGRLRFPESSVSRLVASTADLFTSVSTEAGLLLDPEELAELVRPLVKG